MPGRSEGLPPLPAKGGLWRPKRKRIPKERSGRCPAVGSVLCRAGSIQVQITRHWSERTMDNLQHFRRTDYCGTFTAANVGQEISVCGWVQRQRNLGSLIFVDLRTAPACSSWPLTTAPPGTCLKRPLPSGGSMSSPPRAGPGAGVQESRAAHRGHRGEGHRTPSAGQGGHPAF